jgi:hypothetical protein
LNISKQRVETSKGKISDYQHHYGTEKHKNELEQKVLPE